MLHAFDLLELDGNDLRVLPLSDRKKRLARLLGRGGSGSFSATTPANPGRFNLPARLHHMGLEGIVSSD
jgi:bifunctional non-homologous end joining protein LigD